MDASIAAMPVSMPIRHFRGLGAGGNGGTTNGTPWTALTNENPGDDIDMRILLDTTGGAGTWNTTWFAKKPGDANYTQVRATAPMLTESINAVGVGRSSGDVDGALASFSLADIEQHAYLSTLHSRCEYAAPLAHE